jgi:hypothetical protein
MMSCFLALIILFSPVFHLLDITICPLIFIALFFPSSLFLLQLKIWAIIHMTGLAGDLRGVPSFRLVTA